MAVTPSTSSTAGAVLTAEEMLANAKKAAGPSSSSGSKSAVQKLLEGREDTDTVELSTVARQIAARQAAAPEKKESFTESDDFIRAKVAQLKQQINLYSTLPGLDPSGGVLDNITKQVNDLVKKQQDKLKASQAEAAAKQAELKKQQDAEFQGFSSTELLSRSKELATTGKIAEKISPEAQALLDKLKKVDTTA